MSEYKFECLEFMNDHETLERLRSLKECVISKIRRKIKLKQTSGKRTEKEKQRDRVNFKLLVIYWDVQIK